MQRHQARVDRTAWAVERLLLIRAEVDSIVAVLGHSGEPRELDERRSRSSSDITSVPIGPVPSAADSDPRSMLERGSFNLDDNFAQSDVSNMSIAMQPRKNFSITSVASEMSIAPALPLHAGEVGNDDRDPRQCLFETSFASWQPIPNNETRDSVCSSRASWTPMPITETRGSICSSRGSCSPFALDEKERSLLDSVRESGVWYPSPLSRASTQSQHTTVAPSQTPNESAWDDYGSSQGVQSKSDDDLGSSGRFMRKSTAFRAFLVLQSARDRYNHNPLSGVALLDPKGVFCRVWGTFIGVCVIWECCALPFFMGFAVQLWSMGTLFMTLIFAMDVLVNINTTYESNGSIVVNRREVILHHVVKPFFHLDVIALFPWIMVLPETKSKVHLLPRIVRVYKLGTLGEMVRNMEDTADSHIVSVVVTVTQITCGLLWLIHCSACLLGFATLFDDRDADPLMSEQLYNFAWTRRFGIQEASKSTQYLLALSWAVSVVTGNETDLTPGTIPERCLLAFIAVVAFVASAGITGVIVSTLEEMRFERSEIRGKIRAAKKTLKCMHVPLQLRRKVVRYLSYISHINYRSLESETWLADLSPYMRQEVQLCVCEAALLQQPFFKILYTQAFPVFNRLCSKSESAVYAPGDVIFGRRSHYDELAIASPSPNTAWENVAGMENEETRDAPSISSLRSCRDNVFDDVDEELVNERYIFFLTRGKVRSLNEADGVDRIHEPPFYFGGAPFAHDEAAGFEHVAFAYTEVLRINQRAALQVIQQDDDANALYSTYTLVNSPTSVYTSRRSSA